MKNRMIKLLISLGAEHITTKGLIFNRYGPKRVFLLNDYYFIITSKRFFVYELSDFKYVGNGYAFVPDKAIYKEMLCEFYDFGYMINENGFSIKVNDQYISFFKELVEESVNIEIFDKLIPNNIITENRITDILRDGANSSCFMIFKQKFLGESVYNIKYNLNIIKESSCEIKLNRKYYKYNGCKYCILELFYNNMLVIKMLIHDVYIKGETTIKKLQQENVVFFDELAAKKLNINIINDYRSYITEKDYYKNILVNNNNINFLKLA